MNPHKELVGASTNILVLSVLSKGPSYGYEIIKIINNDAKGAFVWREGTIYPILHKLEHGGYVLTQWEEAETGRKRKYYYITAKGRAVLSQQRETWFLFHQVVVQHLHGDESNA